MKGREAGRTATLSAVRSLTGVPIDYFAEINLAGFYDLAQTLGGVDVCLNHAVYDSYSGADFPAGPQRLDASRGAGVCAAAPRTGQRGPGPHPPAAGLHLVGHAGTPGTGTFTNIDKLKSLMAVARKDVVLSSGWDEELIQRLGGLAGGTSSSGRCPWCATTTSTVRSVNIIDQAAIKAEIAAAIGAAPLDGADPVGGDHAKTQPGHRRRRGQCRQLQRARHDVSSALKKHGYTMGQVRDRNSGDPASTTIEYGAGAEPMPATWPRCSASTPRAAGSDHPAGHIRVTVDTNFSLAGRRRNDHNQRRDHDHHDDDTTSKSSATATAAPAPTRRPIRANRSTAAACPALTSGDRKRGARPRKARWVRLQACVPPSMRISVPV